MKSIAPVSGRVRGLRNLATLVCALLFYYGLPLGFEMGHNWAGKLIGLVAFAAGVAGLSWLTWWRVSRYMADPQAASGRVEGVLFALCVAVTFFALYYYLLEQRSPGQFDGLSTRTDALYYTIVTLGTVGYGDVHAVGQAARIATMVQVVFDLVVIGTLIAVVSTSVTRRVESAAAKSGERD
ncbi:potassium channel family protein [Nocardia australiensis]|uniref:potassium channel family protein n=1 Tax=Nocardia australiensis TaxID=2887191 RepID=UPI001D14FA69|nr:potassium channel family protein [Nocardia australiensis]